MRSQTNLLLLLMFAVCFVGVTWAQDETPPVKTEPAVSEPVPAEQPHSSKAESTTDKIKDTAEKLATQAEAEAEKIAKQVDQMPQAKTVSAGILQPIYVVAEALAFPAFHWVAFALMASGVFSFALQLLLGKLVVLMRFGFSLKEILSDAVGLAISVFGIVLTTQAAAENSTFTQSPAAVISATIVGAVLGLILYFWGQSQELDAVAGRTSAAKAPRK